MSLTISKDIVYTNHGVTSLRTLLDTLMESLLNCWNVLVWNVLTLSLINELRRKIYFTIFLLLRLNVSHDSSELTRSTGLLLVKEVELSFLADALSVVDCRVSDDEVDIILPLHALTIDEQVKLSHS